MINDFMLAEIILRQIKCIAMVFETESAFIRPIQGIFLKLFENKDEKTKLTEWKRCLSIRLI